MLFVLDPGQTAIMMKNADCQKTTVKLDDPNPVWGEEESFRLPVYMSSHSRCGAGIWPALMMR